jgi:hypothetical protein
LQALELQISNSERETIENEHKIKDLEEQVIRAKNTLDIVRAEAADDVVQKVGNVLYSKSHVAYVRAQVIHIRTLNERIIELESNTETLRVLENQV